LTSTATITNTPNASATAGCGLQTVTIYDERGEQVATLCAAINFPAGTAFSMSLSSFTPNPNAPGGTILVYLNNQLVGSWNATESNGSFVPNGFYHFVLQEHTSDGNTVQMERDAFIATYHGETVSLTAWPNRARPGDTIQFTASFAGNPADSQSKIKVYTVSGELVQTLPISGGTASWDLKNSSGTTVASGLYLAALDGVDPLSGQGLTKIVKLLVTH
jgi:hypothetical protein